MKNKSITSVTVITHLWKTCRSMGEYNPVATVVTSLLLNLLVLYRDSVFQSVQ